MFWLKEMYKIQNLITFYCYKQQFTGVVGEWKGENYRELPEVKRKLMLFEGSVK